MESINKILENSAEKFPDKPAIIFENKEITYEEILQKSQFLSNFIQEKTTEGNVILLF